MITSSCDLQASRSKEITSWFSDVIIIRYSYFVNGSDIRWKLAKGGEILCLCGVEHKAGFLSFTAVL
jgi:hypothetical protein